MTGITEIAGLINRQNECLVTEGIFKPYLLSTLSLLEATLFAFSTSVDEDQPRNNNVRGNIIFLFD